MSIIESALYGLISGLVEFLPISSQAMRVVLQRLFGVAGQEPLRDLLVHLSVLIGLLAACRGLISKLAMESRTAEKIAQAQHRRLELRGVYDLRLVKTAAVPTLVGLLICYISLGRDLDLILVMLLSVVNGLLLFIPERIPQGNKDSRAMSAMESVFVGIGAALGGLPGISRIGGAMFAAAVCGADRKHALNWALLLSIPALIAVSVFDIIIIIQSGFGAITGAAVLGYIVTALLAFAGSYMSVMIMRSWVLRSGLNAMAYCSWGMAMFMFVLYLIV